MEVLLVFPWNIYEDYTDFHPATQTSQRLNSAITSSLLLIMYNGDDIFAADCTALLYILKI